MTLIFGQNVKKDTRMIEYDQAIVRLGLEKAMAQTNLDRVHLETVELGELQAKLLDDIEKSETRLRDIRAEIEEAISIGCSNMAVVSQVQQDLDREGKEKSKKFSELENYLTSLLEKISVSSETFTMVATRVNEVRKTLYRVKSELTVMEEEKKLVEQDIISLHEVKKELADSVAASQGLLDEASKRQQYLNRREIDLQKYEKRVEDMRKEAGITSEMKLETYEQI